MRKPIDITSTVLVPKHQPKYDKLNSFFIGRAPMDNVDEGGVEVEANPKEKIKQPHLDNSVFKDTEWKDLY